MGEKSKKLGGGGGMELVPENLEFGEKCSTEGNHGVSAGQRKKEDCVGLVVLEKYKHQGPGGPS